MSNRPDDATDARAQPARFVAIACLVIAIVAAVAWSIGRLGPTSPVHAPRSAAYRGTIAETAAAIESGDIERARRLLHAIAARERRWEWRYLEGIARSHGATARDEPEVLLRGHEGPVRDVAWSPDGRRLVSADEGAVRIWDAAGGSLLAVLTDAPAPVHAVAWSPDGRTIVASGGSGLHTWYADTGAPVRQLQGDPGGDSEVLVNPDGYRMALIPEGGEVLVWRITWGDETGRLPHAAGARARGAFSPGGRFLAYTDAGGIVRVADLSQEIRERRLSISPSAPISLDWNAEGSLIAAGDEAGSIGLFRPRRAERIAHLRPGGGAITAVAFAPDGTLLASGDDTGAVHLWHVPSGALLLALPGHRDRINALAFSRDGARLVSASADGTMRIRDTIAAPERHTAARTMQSLRDAQDQPLDRLLATRRRWRRVADGVHVDLSLTEDEREARLQRLLQRAIADRNARQTPKPPADESDQAEGTN